MIEGTQGFWRGLGLLTLGFTTSATFHSRNRCSDTFLTVSKGRPMSGDRRYSSVRSARFRQSP